MEEFRIEDLELGDFVQVYREGFSAEGRISRILKPLEKLDIALDSGELTLYPTSDWRIFKTVELPKKDYAMVGCRTTPYKYPIVYLYKQWWRDGSVVDENFVRELLAEGYEVLFEGIDEEEEES